MILRPMQIKDLKTVLRIENESFHSSWSENQFLEEINAEENRAWTAEILGETVGYMTLFPILNEMHLTNIAVDKNYHRNGIGRELVRKVEEIALEKYCTEITLEVRDGNEPAISLYEKHKFECVGRRKNYYASEDADALIMTKKTGGKYELV